MVAQALCASLSSCGEVYQLQPAAPAREPQAIAIAPPASAQSSSSKPAERGKKATAAKQPAAVRVGDADFVALAALPAGFRADGALQEWATFDVSDTGAQSHVAASLTPRELAIAADLESAYAGGFWLHLRFPFRELPHIGTYGYGGGVIHPFQCEVHPLRRVPVGEAEKAACERRLAAMIPEQARLAARYEARFQRTYRIDPSGIRVLEGSGTLRPIAGASHGFSSTTGRVHAELAIPALALPSASDAPASSMLFGISALPEPQPPSFPAEKLAQVWFPHVNFEPFGEARALLLRNSRPTTTRLVYQPGEGMPVEVFRYRDRWGYDDNPSDLTMLIVSRPQQLYTPVRKLGRVEVAFGFEEAMAALVFVDGALKDVVGMQGTLHNVVERDGKLHVLSGVAYWEEESQQRKGAWEVGIVGQDGSYNSVSLPELPWIDWTSVKTFHNQDWSEFGLQGRTKQSAKKVGWRWDAGRKAYVRAGG